MSHWNPASSEAACTGTWTCFKCGRPNAPTERSCANCAYLAQRVVAKQAVLKQEAKPVDNRVWTCVKCGYGFNFMDSDTCVCGASISDKAPETKVVDVCVSMLLVKEGWQCEMCNARNQLHSMCCFNCQRLNSIGQALFQQCESCFGESH